MSEKLNIVRNPFNVDVFYGQSLFVTSKNTSSNNQSTIDLDENMLP